MVSTTDGAATDASAKHTDGLLAVDPACTGVVCGVADGCCVCEAFDTSGKPPVDCPTALCDQTLCPALGIDPLAYCLQGQCLLGSRDACSTDSDCGMVDDCCRCAALPRSIVPVVQSQCAAYCLQPTCNGMGLGQAKPRCVAGVCRLSL